MREEIEETREDLGDTVEQLAQKADVKAQAQAKVDETKQQAQAKVEETKQQAQAKVTRPENPAPVAGIAAGVAGLLLLLWLHAEEVADGQGALHTGQHPLQRARRPARGAVFKQVWKRISDEEESPKALESEYGWKEILPAAALQGAIFALVKAVVQRGGARGVQKADRLLAGRLRQGGDDGDRAQRGARDASRPSASPGGARGTGAAPTARRTSRAPPRRTRSSGPSRSSRPTTAPTRPPRSPTTACWRCSRR